MCRAGLCSPEGHGAVSTADSFYVQSKPTPEHLAVHFLCQKDKSGFHLFEIHDSERSPTWSSDLTVWLKNTSTLQMQDS